MDSTRAILEAHYPRCRWTRLGTHWSGRCGPVMIAVYATNTGWAADGQVSAGSLVDRGTGADMHAALRDLASFDPLFVDALHPTPYEQPQRQPFPASGLWWLGKGCLWVAVDIVRELMPSRWALLLFGMALACGAGGMWWLTGGAP